MDIVDVLIVGITALFALGLWVEFWRRRVNRLKRDALRVDAIGKPISLDPAWPRPLPRVMRSPPPTPPLRVRNREPGPATKSDSDFIIPLVFGAAVGYALSSSDSHASERTHETFSGDGGGSGGGGSSGSYDSGSSSSDSGSSSSSSD